MNFLADVLTYMRRIIKTPSNASISDDLLIDYVNRFYIMDMDARIQLFDFKTSYKFYTQPNVINYNMPLYEVVSANGTTIGRYPMYQGFCDPVYVNGFQTSFYSDQQSFFSVWPSYLQTLPNAAVGDGGATYTLQAPYNPIIPGHVDMAGIIQSGQNLDPPLVTNLLTSIPATSVKPGLIISTTDSQGNNVVVTDSGQFLQSNVNFGLLVNATTPIKFTALQGGYSITKNTVDYSSGEIRLTFTDANGSPINIPQGNPIQIMCYFFQQGMPRGVMFYNNTITLKNPPDTQYQIEMTAYLTPAAFLSSSAALPYAYMAEYIARGAARKILSDTGDIEQFQFYEPLFREQESLVWKRSQRQVTSTRVQTIFSQQGNMPLSYYNNTPT
jgi:hypothetical protein